ncbi:hypothetical protein KIL84_011442 [Mauremys mutica]|uniref:Uncharacterized protein n=1 Tax=Mauremys mutica TaxID=74926 RepID=A0A9D3XEU0_9SAUR|nr:hypothetical protein KIL84_011442 [Mauremys mutica]
MLFNVGTILSPSLFVTTAKILWICAFINKFSIQKEVLFFYPPTYLPVIPHENEFHLQELSLHQALSELRRDFFVFEYESRKDCGKIAWCGEMCRLAYLVMLIRLV